MHFPIGSFSRNGVLTGRKEGEIARAALEREISGTGPTDPIAVDFSGVDAVSVPFAEGFFVPLLAGRLAGYYDEQPFLVVGATEDVSATIAAALRPTNLGVLVIADKSADVLGGEASLRETMRVAHELREFSVAEIAAKLNLSQQTANNRLSALHKRGAVVRTRITPPGGGKEFVYRVPDPDG